MSDKQHVLHGPKDDAPLPNVPLGEYLLRRLRELGDNVAQVYPSSDETYTYAEILARSMSVAEEFRGRGVRPGDVVAVISYSCSEFAPIMVGALCVGALLAPLNPKFDNDDLKRMLTLYQPKVVFCDPAVATTLQTILPHLEPRPEVVSLDKGPLWRQWVEHEPSTDFRTEDIADFKGREAVIMCSSGTSGLPKGVMLTHGGIYAQLYCFSIEEGMFEGQDVMLQIVPLFWISGLLMQTLCISQGTKVIVLPAFQVDMFLKTVQSYEVTFTVMAPNLAVEIAKCPALKQYNISSLRYIICAGSTMSKDTQHLVQQRINRKICQWYGMTEILIVVSSRLKDKNKEGASGRILLNITAKVLDTTTGQTLGPMQQGELCFKSPCLTKGYYRNPEATAAVIDTDGFIHTGDVGYYDEDQYFYVVDRIKDLIKYRGHHVAAVELETLLLDHPEVKDAAVVGIKHELDQEWPLAFVVRQPGASVSEEELVQLVKGQLAEHKWLRGGVRFVDSIPKTPTGKTRRVALRELRPTVVQTATAV